MKPYSKLTVYEFQQGKRIEQRITKILNFLLCSLPILLAVVFVINI